MPVVWTTSVLAVAEPVGIDAMGLVALIKVAGPGRGFEARVLVVIGDFFPYLRILCKKGFISLSSE